MSELQHRTDVVEVGLGRLIQQFRGKPRLVALLGIYLEEFQELEDARWDVFTKTFIDDGEGIQLDGIGEILQEQRQGIDDEWYRPFLRARVRVLRSTGKVAEIIRIVLLIQEDGAPVRVREAYPASWRIEPTTEVGVNALRMNRMLQAAKTDASCLHFVYSKEAEEDSLKLGSSYGGDDVTEDQSPGSFYTAPDIVGGSWAGVFG